MGVKALTVCRLECSPKVFRLQGATKRCWADGLCALRDRWSWVMTNGLWVPLSPSVSSSEVQAARVVSGCTPDQLPSDLRCNIPTAIRRTHQCALKQSDVRASFLKRLSFANVRFTLSFPVFTFCPFRSQTLGDVVGE